MTTIECSNTECKRAFEWDERPFLLPLGKVVAPGTPGSTRLQAPCPYCKAICAIGLIGMKARDNDDQIIRE